MLGYVQITIDHRIVAACLDGGNSERQDKTGECRQMKLPETGGCQCGAIRYEITQAPQMIYACHCADCQRMTSSAFSMALVLPVDAFRLLSGEPKAIRRTADSGRVTTWWICPECGSWVCSGPSLEATRNVRAGTLDDTSSLHTTVHFWTRNKQPWIALPEGAQNFETQPEDLLGFFFSKG
jgi:hypothetical protein